MGTFSGEAAIVLYVLPLSHLQIWISPLFIFVGWSDGEMGLGKLLVPGVLLIWIIVGEGPAGLAVDVDGGCLDIFFSHLSCSVFFLSLFWGWPDVD